MRQNLSEQQRVDLRNDQYQLAVMILRGTERDETYAARTKGRSRSNEVSLTVLVLPVLPVQRQIYVRLRMTEVRMQHIKLGNMKMVLPSLRGEVRDTIRISDRTTEGTATFLNIREIVVVQIHDI